MHTDIFIGHDKNENESFLDIFDSIVFIHEFAFV